MDEVVTNPAIERDPRVLLVLSQAVLDYIEGLVRASGGNLKSLKYYSRRSVVVSACLSSRTGVRNHVLFMADLFVGPPFPFPRTPADVETPPEPGPDRAV